MGQKTWKGGATAVVQVSTITMNSDTSGHVYTLNLADESGGSASVSFTSTGGGTTANATGLKNAAVASNDPRFKAVTVTSNTNVVTITANTGGVPFYATMSGTGAGDTTTATTTPNQGPNDWGWAGNWIENAIPVNSDNVVLDGSNGIKYGLQTGLALGGFRSLSTYSGTVGAQGQYLNFTCTSFNWAGQGTAYVNIGSSAIAPNILKTASQSDPACGLYLLGSAMTTLTVMSGSVDIAGMPGQTSSVTTIQLEPSTNSTPRVNIGSGVTLTSYYQIGGAGTVNCAATTIVANAGTLSTFGSGAVGTLTNNGATVYSNSSGTITNLNWNAGVTDLTQSQVARTVTNCTGNPGKGAQLLFDSSVITFSNKIAGSGRMTLTAA